MNTVLCCKGENMSVYNCERSELSSVFNGQVFHYIYMYISGRTSCCNVLNVSTCVSKYLPNAIFPNANINA